ncbi:MAG TPA: pyridoxamine 5'-phosphate oxidase family protein [Sunxiuqinia sp.]|nr:pyridoxamine 5'-phosphate oxidase family protein [Sunxiuqinia sp.]
MGSLITSEIQNALQGIVPSVMATTSPDGLPNLTYISQAHFVDDKHLAISWQFFNKTWKNLQTNPNFSVVVTAPQNWAMWKIKLRFVELLKEGELFDEMEIALEAIATMQGAADVFKLAAVLMCEIVSIETQFHGITD